MSTIISLRKDVQKYIETADERVVKMVHAMLEADSKANLLHKLPVAAKKSPLKATNLTGKKSTDINGSSNLKKRRTELAKAFEDIKLHETGKKKLKLAKDLLNEL